MTINDDSLMPFGKYRNVKMANVPASYLIWLYNTGGNTYSDVRAYIKNNLEILQKEVEQINKYKKNETY